MFLLPEIWDSRLILFLYQLAFGKIGFVVCHFALKSQFPKPLRQCSVRPTADGSVRFILESIKE